LVAVIELNTGVLSRSRVEPLDPATIFGRVAPLQVDLGCGDGFFLFQLAQIFPEKNFLGIELLVHRVAKAGRKASKIDNMRVFRLETSYAVEHLLPPESVEAFYLSFPDPWPKRRHHRRRIFTKEFLNSIHCALERNGILRIATDHLDYFQQINKTALAEPGFAAVNREEIDLPQTRFETRFRAAGHPIYRLSLRRISPVV
jgi:tRNA (guanine-N7-)-methyltransferase